MSIRKLTEDFIADLNEQKDEYDSIFIKMKACLGNRICQCKCSHLCLNCKQDGRLFDEISALEHKEKQ